MQGRQCLLVLRLPSEVAGEGSSDVGDRQEPPLGHHWEEEHVMAGQGRMCGAGGAVPDSALGYWSNPG